MAKKYIDADLLRKEIERRKKVIHATIFNDEYNDLLAWIDSLQQEQPCDTCTNDKGCVTCKDGELWEGKEQPSEDLEEEIKRYIPRDQCPVPDFMEAVARHFAEWQKEQMLKEAVEGEVIEDLHGQRYVKSEAVDGTKFKFGDKVKIVITPEKED